MAAAPRQRRTSSATDAPTLRPRKGDDLLLRPFQREDVDFIKRNNYRVLVANAPGTGKAQPLDAKVLTSTGWTSIGALRVGDKVIDPDGGTAEVLGVFPQGVKKVYRVTVAGGGSTECCAEHLWTVQTNRDKRTKRSRTLPLSALRASGLERLATAKNPWSSAKYFLPSAVPADFAPVDDHDLPLDPYLLGVILGDGSVSAAGNSVGFTSADKDIVEAVRHALPRGVALKEHTRSKYGWRISRETGSQRNTVRAALEYIGVFGKKAEDKGVPGAYLHASQGVRLALLRGLLDTDGDCGKGYATFNTSSPQLAADVAFLVGSLGGFTTTTSRVPTYWHKGEGLPVLARAQGHPVATLPRRARHQGRRICSRRRVRLHRGFVKAQPVHHRRLHRHAQHTDGARLHQRRPREVDADAHRLPGVRGHELVP